MDELVVARKKHSNGPGQNEKTQEEKKKEEKKEIHVGLYLAEFVFVYI